MKYCPKCGKECPDTAAFCASCGTAFQAAASEPQNNTNSQQPQPSPYNTTYAPPTEPAYQPSYQPSLPTNICGVIGFILAFFFPPVGIILSIIGTVNGKKTPMSNQGLTKAGLILNIIFLVLFVLYIIFFVVVMIIAASTGEMSSFYPYY